MITYCVCVVLWNQLCIEQLDMLRRWPLSATVSTWVHPRFFSGVRVARSVVLCAFCMSLFLLWYLQTLLSHQVNICEVVEDHHEDWCVIVPMILNTGLWFTMFNATFNNISVISWRSVLLVEEPGDIHRPAASHWQTLSHNVKHLAFSVSRTHNISGDRHRLHR